jgi:hypothetical protein
LLDDVTGYKVVVCLKSKAEIPAALIAELNKLMTRTGRNIMFLRTDRGTEFLNYPCEVMV